MVCFGAKWKTGAHAADAGMGGAHAADAGRGGAQAAPSISSIGRGRSIN